MNARTRRFLVGSAAIVVGGLGVGLFAYYNGGLPVGASSVAPTELAYVPADATAVGYANVRDILNSEFRQKMQQVLPTGQERDKIEAELGINFERDIDSLVAGFTGTEPGPDNGLMLVRGRFNFTTIEALAVQHGAAVEEYRGKRMLISTGDSRDTSGGGASHFDGGVAFLEGDLLALGEAGALRRAIDAGATRQDVTTNADLMRFVSQIDQTSNAWIVGRFDAVSESASLPAEVRDRIPPVQWIAASARLNGGIQATLKAETRDDQSGEQLRDVVRGALAAAQLMTGQDARLDQIVKSIQVQGVGNSVTVNFTVPSELLDMINGLAAAERLSGGR
jgi:hypothetical protein